MIVFLFDLVAFLAAGSGRKIEGQVVRTWQVDGIPMVRVSVPLPRAENLGGGTYHATYDMPATSLVEAHRPPVAPTPDELAALERLALEVFGALPAAA